MSSTEHLFLVSLHLLCMIENILSTYPVEDGTLSIEETADSIFLWTGYIIDSIFGHDDFELMI